MEPVASGLCEVMPEAGGVGVGVVSAPHHNVTDNYEEIQVLSRSSDLDVLLFFQLNRNKTQVII